jgi:hypothetical protein
MDASNTGLTASQGPQIELAEHGIDTKLYSAMAAEATEHLKSRFARTQFTIMAGSGDRIVDGEHTYVLWSPYERFDNAWWVEIPKSTWHDEWGYGTQADVLNGVPRTIAKEDGGSGYDPRPFSDAVYFPLFEPAVGLTDADGDSWRAYLRLRKANPSFRLKSTSRSVDNRRATSARPFLSRLEGEGPSR